MKSFIEVTDKPWPAEYFSVLHWLAPLALFFETTDVLYAIAAGHFCSKKELLFSFLIQH